MKIKYFDPENNIVNFSNSILKKYGAEPFHPGIAELDEIIKNKSNIVILLFDGMGRSLLHKHLSRGSCLRFNKVFTMTSTFPPTTTAATNSLLTGRYPIETGWLGWAQYFKEEGRVIELFSGRDYLTGEQVKGRQFGQELLKNETIFSLIQKKNPHLYINTVWPSFIEGGAADLPSFFDRIGKECQVNRPKLVYGYWDEPDKIVHESGTEHENVKNNIRYICQKVEELGKTHAHTTFVVLADHSLVDTEDIEIRTDRGIGRLLKYPVSNEGRSAFFFVKDKKHREFARQFNKQYGEYFILKTKEEVLKENWFGYGEPHPASLEFIGDFMAVSVDKHSFSNYREKGARPFMARHAGLTEEETLIDVIIINK